MLAIYIDSVMPAYEILITWKSSRRIKKGKRKTRIKNGKRLEKMKRKEKKDSRSKIGRK